MARLRVAVLCAALLLLPVGCAVPEQMPLQQSFTPEPSSSAGAFDPVAWRSGSSDQGRTLAAARDLVERSVLDQMTLAEVQAMLGAPTAQAVPVDYEGGDAEIEYDLAEGPMLFVRFHDGVVSEVEIVETAGSPEEALRLVGVWEVGGGGSVRRMTFRRSGFLTRQVEIEDQLKWRVGRWRVIEPGTIVCFRPRWAESTYVAAVYEVDIDGDRMTLTYAPEKPEIEDLHSRSVVWTPWLAGEGQTAIELRRIGDSESR